MVSVVGGDLADRLHPEGGGEQLLFKLEPDRSGVPQGSMWGPMLFNIITNYLEDGLKCTLTKFANTKLSREVGISEGSARLQEDRDRLEE